MKSSYVENHVEEDWLHVHRQIVRRVQQAEQGQAKGGKDRPNLLEDANRVTSLHSFMISVVVEPIVVERSRRSTGKERPMPNTRESLSMWQSKR